MIVLFNPISTSPGKQPLPLSLLSLAAVLEERSPESGLPREPWSLVDGNLVDDPAAEIIARLSTVPRSDLALLAVTVMPGPQLTQAVAVCKRVRQALPHAFVVWGGYFPTQHGRTVLRARYVDFVIRSQGERSLLQLVRVLRTRGLLNSVGGLSWKAGDEVVENPIQPLTTLDDLPDLPYHRVGHDALSPQELPRCEDGRAQLVVRLSICVQLLRGRRDVESALAGAVAGASRTRHAPPGHDLQGRRGSDARHGLLHLRGADGGILRPHRQPGASMVGAGSRRSR